MSATIRIASPADAQAIIAIYGGYCEATAVSFELQAPSIEDMAQRIRHVTTQWPWLVMDDDGVVAGYAYASRHRERAAYSWAVDGAVYIASSHLRQGVGRALYTALFQLLRRQGYFTVCAGITLPNPASVRLHESVGFVPVGIYRRIGYKLGAWHDVAWYQAELQPARSHPGLPVSIADLSRDAGGNDALLADSRGGVAPASDRGTDLT